MDFRIAPNYKIELDRHGWGGSGFRRGLNLDLLHQFRDHNWETLLSFRKEHAVFAAITTGLGLIAGAIINNLGTAQIIAQEIMKR